ncbi:MAG: hypothetical protein QHJ73_00745 [Armatimonadota bacterium]|nr:hypothetical protein [Armatimonadota bacterium]
MFVRGGVEEAAGLVAKLDDLSKKTPKLKVFVVFQSGMELRPALEKLAKEKGIQVPLTIPQALQDTLKLYKIDPAAKNTVMVYVGKKVTFNAVNVTPEEFAPVAAAAQKAAE